MTRTRSESAHVRTLGRIAAVALCAGTALLATPAALAQSRTTAQRGVEIASTGSPFRDNALKMLVPVTVSFENQRLDNVMTFIQQYTGAELEPLWIDDDNSEGLDPEALVTLEAKDITALDLLERVLEKVAARDTLATGNSWQFTTYGAIEFGPKERLNRPAARRIEMYDINDLLFVIPTYDNAPDFDLQSVLQSGGGGGGGGGQSPFQENDQEDRVTVPREERAQEVIDLITQLCEFDAWTDNGGDAATIRYYQGSLIVRAPDYVHRSIAGYPWWPSARTVRRVSQGNGGRWVTISGMTALAGPYQFRNVPSASVVPGGGGGGGGGGTPGGPPGGGG